MKKLFLLVFVSILMAACGGSDDSNTTTSTATDEASAPKETDVSQYDPNRGIGKFKDVDVPAEVDKSMAASGEKVYEVKCSGCHKLTDERLVGPGWQGVSTRHQPEWILNFVTNTDEMISKDPKVQAQLEICLVRMPNQNLTDEEARSVYEFMRMNDTKH